MQGLVCQTFIKKHEGIELAPRLKLLRNTGIVGDIKGSTLSPCHVLIASKEVLEQYNLPSGSLNENICVSNFDTRKLVQGNILQIGSAKVKVMYANEPCKVVACNIISNRGVLAIVIQDGEVSIGDKITLSSNVFENIPQNRSGLFAHFVYAIPKGKVVTYKEVVAAIGGTSSHLRVLPAFVKKGYLLGLPVHRIVDSSGRLISKFIPDQASCLEHEGVRIYKNRTVDLNQYVWRPDNHLFL